MVVVVVVVVVVVEVWISGVDKCGGLMKCYQTYAKE